MAHDPSVAGAFETTLERERVRNARAITVLRIVVLGIVLGIMAAMELGVAGWIGPPLAVFVGWFGFAVALGVVAMRSERVARLSPLVVQLIDMPLLYLVVSRTIAELRTADIVADASRLGFASGIYYVALIVASALALEPRYVATGAVLAGVFEVLLANAGGMEPALVVVSVVVTLVIAAALTYLVGQSRRLIDEVVVEHSRRARLARYFSPHVAAQLETEGELRAEGQTCEVSVLFSDLRDFTQLGERLSEQQVVALLNAHYERMVETVFQFDGTLDKYLGDGLMVYFGAPLAQADHAERAVRCAIAMQNGLAVWNVERAAAGEPVLAMGVGIHSGTVVVGSIGARRRREYTAIGDTVNVAARLEQLTKEHQTSVLVSDEVRRRCPETLEFARIGEVNLRGRARGLCLYTVIASDASSRVAMPGA